jgi:hypothetical protein
MAKKNPLFETLATAEDQSLAREAAFMYLRQTSRDENKRLRLINPEDGSHLLAFEANGTKYRVVTAEEGLGLRRAQALRVAASQMGFDAALTDQLASLQSIEKLLNKQDWVRAAAGIVDMQAAIKKAWRQYPYAAEACSLFILAEGEDLKEVPSQAQTAAKLEDWAAEGLHEQDFFFLCLAWLREWNGALSDFYLLMAGR